MFLSPHSSLLSPRLWAPSGGSGPLRRACAPFAAKAAQGWRSPLRRRRQGLSPIGAVSRKRPPLCGGIPPGNAPLQNHAPPPPPWSPATIPYPPQFPRPSASSADKKGVKVFSAPLRGSKVLKVFFVPLRGPSWIKRFKVFSVPLRGPPWIKGF